MIPFAVIDIVVVIIFVFVIVFDAVRCVHGWLALLMIPFVVVVVFVVIILFLLLYLMQCGVYMDGWHF